MTVYAPGTAETDPKKQNRALQAHAAAIEVLQGSPTAKAWVNFTGSTAAINSSFNIASVSRTSAGLYVVTFTTAFSSANYVALVITKGTNLVANVTTQTASAVTVQAFNLSGTATDPTSVMVLCFG